MPRAKRGGAGEQEKGSIRRCLSPRRAQSFIQRSTARPAAPVPVLMIACACSDEMLSRWGGAHTPFLPPRGAPLMREETLRLISPAAGHATKGWLVRRYVDLIMWICEV